MLKAVFCLPNCNFNVCLSVFSSAVVGLQSENTKQSNGSSVYSTYAAQLNGCVLTGPWEKHRLTYSLCPE